MKLLKVLACTMLVSTAMVCAMDGDMDFNGTRDDASDIAVLPPSSYQNVDIDGLPFKEPLKAPSSDGVPTLISDDLLSSDDLIPGLSARVKQLSFGEKPNAAPLGDSVAVPVVVPVVVPGDLLSAVGSEGRLRRVPGQQQLGRSISSAVNPSAAPDGFDMFASQQLQPSAVPGIYGVGVPTSARSRRLHVQEPLSNSLGDAPAGSHSDGLEQLGYTVGGLKVLHSVSAAPDAAFSHHRRSATNPVITDDTVDAQLADDKAGALSSSAAPVGGPVRGAAPSRRFGGRTPSGW